MHVLLHSLPPTLQQATTNPCLCWRLLDTPGQVWVSLLWVQCAFLLGPGAHMFVCALQESISQSWVSSGSSMVGIMATSSKRAHTYPSLLHPEPVPLQKSTADPYLHSPVDEHSLVSVSVGSLGPGAHKVCMSPLSNSGRNGV